MTLAQMGVAPSGQGNPAYSGPLAGLLHTSNLGAAGGTRNADDDEHARHTVVYQRACLRTQPELARLEASSPNDSHLPPESICARS